MFVFTQAPEQQDSLPEHVRPHAPQLPTSLPRVAQTPSQQRCPPPHGALPPQRHVPAEQVSPGPQAGSHGTSVVQPPARQTSPAPHALPQKPQFDASVCVSTQPPPQQAPVVQLGPTPQRHSLPMQTCLLYTSPSPRD